MPDNFFSLLPDLKYDTKPIEYPFSQSDYTLMKNFFKTYKIDDVFAFKTSESYEKYIINDNFTRVEQVAEAYYGEAYYDWIIILTNKLVNPQFDWPMTSVQLRDHVERNYTDPYSTIRHYEIISNADQEERYGRVLFEEGTRMDEAFYNSGYQYWDGTGVASVPGSLISSPVTQYEYEYKINEERREVYLLKSQYVSAFINYIKRQNTYKSSSSYVSRKVKETNK